MDPFFESLIVRAATIDEILSNDFVPIKGQKPDAELAGRRLARWCCSCANGDWSLFSRRLKRDGLSIDDVLARFATIRPNPLAALPAWVKDAIWIEGALSKKPYNLPAGPIQPVPFEHLFLELVREAELRLWADLPSPAFENFSPSAHTSLRRSLLHSLSSLSAPIIYERFDKIRTSDNRSKTSSLSKQAAGTALYENFVVGLAEGGLREIIRDKPVLLRLIAVITRQWIDSSRELVARLQEDIELIRASILASHRRSQVDHIDGGLSDFHNEGRSVQVIQFDDGSRIVYKPKDLRLDVAWKNLISILNEGAPPFLLKTVNAISRDGYGWTEFINHQDCETIEGCKRFFERAGAWLALFHCFGGTDFHQENIIASGEYPIPIDLETILQPHIDRQRGNDAEAEAYDAAIEIISNSVLMVGLLPSFIRSTNDETISIGGLAPYQSRVSALSWENINTDEMRPLRVMETRSESPNLPRVNTHYAKLGDHREEFVKGFRDYARYLISKRRDGTLDEIFKDFVGLPVRRIIRQTRFYSALIQRLKNCQSMDDGIIWSAQADFGARLSNWDLERDPFWPLQYAERCALLNLNVPHFLTTSDGCDVYDHSGTLVSGHVLAGVERARVRLQGFDEREIEWQLSVIEEDTNTLSPSAGVRVTCRSKSELSDDEKVAASNEIIFLAEANRIAEDLNRYAIRRGPSAAWLGLDQRHSEFSKLVALGPDLYNGQCGISLFLAAHTAATGLKSSEELALAAVAHLRKSLRSQSIERMVRFLGIGGTGGLGSIVYSLTAMAKCLGSDALIADAYLAAELFTDDLIGADKRLDVMHGSAGGILGLLSLYRQNKSTDVLKRAIKCGEHLLRQERRGCKGRRSWVGQGAGSRLLNGMSHGAAGYAYALASLAAAAEREDFLEAASECIAFENSSFDAGRNNWPDWREVAADDPWRSQWCNGATGIGLARLATLKLGILDSSSLRRDVDCALVGAEREWPGLTDTMCCGTLGTLELFLTAGKALSRNELVELGSRRLSLVVGAASSREGYRWYYGNKKQFNLSLFLGLAGVGYTCLRHTRASLPNVLIWD